MKHGRDYKDHKITWHVHGIAKVNRECLEDGKFPNGRKLTPKDREECKEQIEAAEAVLLKYGCVKQGELF